MRLVLARHGESLLNVENRYQGRIETTLSERGEAQARQLAEGCRGLGATMLYSSPAMRAKQTAQAVAKATGLPIQLHDGLREANMGELEGMKHREAAAKWPELAEMMRRDMGAVTFPGGESVRDMQERAFRSIMELFERHGEATVIAVTHSYTIRALICKILELALSRFESYDLDTVSLTTVSVTARGARLVALNDTCHLRATIPVSPTAH